MFFARIRISNCPPLSATAPKFNTPRPPIMPQQVAGFVALFLTTSLLSIGQGAVTSVTLQKGAVFGFSETFLGLVISFGYVGFVVGNYLMRYLLWRVSYIRAFAVCASAIGVIALMMPVMTEQASWLGLRFLHGLFFSAATITCEGWVNSKAGKENRSRILGAYMTVNYLCYGLSQYALLIETPAFAFSASAACMILSLIPVCLTRFAEPQYVSARDTGGKSLSIVDVYRIAPVAFIGQFVVGVANGVGWLFVRYAESLPLSEGGVALMAALFFSSGFLLQVPVGWLSDRARDRRDIISITSALSAASAFVLFWGDLLPFFVLAAVSLVFGSVMATVFALNVAYGQDFVQREKAPEYSGGLFQAYAAGAIIGPVVAGQLMDLFSPAWMFLVAGLVMAFLTACAATTRIMPKIRPVKTDAEPYAVPTPSPMPTSTKEGEVYSTADIGPQPPEPEDENDDGDGGGESANTSARAHNNL